MSSEYVIVKVLSHTIKQYVVPTSTLAGFDTGDNIEVDRNDMLDLLEGKTYITSEHLADIPVDMHIVTPQEVIDLFRGAYSHKISDQDILTFLDQPFK